MSNGILLGAEKTGKTLLLRQLRKICEDAVPASRFRRNWHPAAEVSAETVATVGVELEVLNYRKETVCIREIGGAMTPMWKSYFADSEYMIYVIDISDAIQISTSAVELYNALNCAEVSNKPVLVVLNKMDLPCSLSLNTIKSLLCFDDLVEHFQGISFHLVSALTGENMISVLQWIQSLTSIKGRLP